MPRKCPVWSVENGASIGVRGLIEQTLPELKLKPDYAILGEPTGLGLYYGHDGWIEVDLQRPTAIHAMAFDEPHRGAGKRGQKYRLQMRAGDQWKEIIAGATEGYGATRIFPTVTGQVFRLQIFESKDTAAVSELQLYRPE